jgi:RND family efflux transporter MFP subunit
MSKIKQFFAYLNSFSRTYKIIGAAVLVVLVVVLLHLKGAAPAAEVADASTHVVLASVASLSSQGGPLPLTGKVTSVSQASISALSGGQITSLPHKLGDRVAAGAVLASFENSSQQAAVLQAQGSYESALAGQRAVSPVDAAAAARNAFESAYSTLDTVVHADIDTFFGSPSAYGPTLLIPAPMYDFAELPRERTAITESMNRYRDMLASAGSADPAALLAQATAVVSQVSDLLTKLGVAAQDRNSRATAEQLSALAAARSAVSSLSSTLSTATQTYRSSSVTTTSSTDASVTIALGGLRAAQANLEKTYVRAPISGTIVSLPVHRGDFIAPGTLVSIISNPGALQVESYVTSADAKTLSVGGKATIEEKTQGTIVFIAPALDPTTGKVQVKIGLNGSTALTDGSTVAVTLERAAASSASKKNAITIPIAAAKITPQGPVVFTVASSTLVSHPITFGTILGGQVEVTEGLSPDMDIVVDARGLSEGQVVVVDSE